jgi:hypothetical protein
MYEMPSEADAVASCDLHLERTVAVRRLPTERERWCNGLGYSDRVFREAVDDGVVEQMKRGELDEDVMYAVQSLASLSARRTALLKADLFYATSEFTTLLAGAWPTVPLDSMAVTPPVGSGFVYLQQPMPMDTGTQHGVLMVRGITWTVLQPTGEHATPLLVVWVTAYDTVHHIGRSEMARVQVKDGRDGSALEDYEVSGGADEVAQIGMAAMLLLQQDNLVTTEDHEPSEAARKARGRKAQQRKHEPVKVVRLRRATRRGLEEAHAAEASERHVRWIVRGHWRQQACGKGRTERRRIYIAPHYKGPEDGTLIVRETVFQW